MAKQIWVDKAIQEAELADLRRQGGGEARQTHLIGLRFEGHRGRGADGFSGRSAFAVL